MEEEFFLLKIHRHFLIKLCRRNKKKKKKQKTKNK